LAEEKPEDWAIRLHHKSEDQKKCFANETVEGRIARLEKYKREEIAVGHYLHLYQMENSKLKWTIFIKKWQH